MESTWVPESQIILTIVSTKYRFEGETHIYFCKTQTEGWKMLLNKVLMWILKGSHQLDLEAEREKSHDKNVEVDIIRLIFFKPEEEVAVLREEEQA